MCSSDSVIGYNPLWIEVFMAANTNSQCRFNLVGAEFFYCLQVRSCSFLFQGKDISRHHLCLFKLQMGVCLHHWVTPCARTP